MTTTTVLITLTHDADNMLTRFARLVAVNPTDVSPCEHCDIDIQHVAIQLSLDADFSHSCLVHPACLTTPDTAAIANAVTAVY